MNIKSLLGDPRSAAVAQPVSAVIELRESAFDFGLLVTKLLKRRDLGVAIGGEAVSIASAPIGRTPGRIQRGCQVLDQGFDLSPLCVERSARITTHEQSVPESAVFGEWRELVRIWASQM